MYDKSMLLDLLEVHSLKFAEPGKPFILASGKESNFFLDVKQTALNPDGIECISELIYEALTAKNVFGEVQAVAGVALGGCPLATGVSFLSVQRWKPAFDYNSNAAFNWMLDADAAQRNGESAPTYPKDKFVPMWDPFGVLYVRKEVKDHGTQQLIEGKIKPGMRVALLEDVVTTGNSSFKAVEALEAAGVKVVGVLAVLDRLEGAAEAFKAKNIPLVALATIKDLEIYNG